MSLIDSPAGDATLWPDPAVKEPQPPEERPEPAPPGRGRLEGRVAIVTGAARGQGEATARLFVAEGATVLVADVLLERAAHVAADLGDAARAFSLDVANAAGWAQAVAACVDAFGPPTVLVNNAGIMPVATLDDTDEELMRRTLDVNVMGAFLGIRAVKDAMAEAGGGSIINVSSINGFKAGKGLTAYTVSKFALRGLTRQAALELGHRHIRVNSLHPGPIDTEMINSARLRAVRKIEPGHSPLADRAIPRRGTSEEMAKVSLFLASDESSFCTGSEFVADGGALL